MNLSDRKKKILSAVIDENIASAEPVSSGQLQKDYLNDLSSATIRNELATLEEMGFLYQPHTSAGRVPTLEGIKFYIDEILPTIKERNIGDLISDFDANLDNISVMLKQTAQAISEATNYTSLMYLGLYDLAIIKQVGLIKLDATNTLAVIVTDRGIIKDVVNLENSKAELESATKILTSIFKGKTLRQMEQSDYLITEEIEKYKFMFEILVNMVLKQEQACDKVAIEGKDKIFNYPEFNDVKKLKKVVNIFEEPNKLYPLLKDNENLEISVEIGKDDLTKDCAIVTASYKVGNKIVGKAGVMGPVRMDYKNVISILKGISQSLSQKLNKDNEKEGE